MKKKFIVIFGLVCLAILLFFVFKNDNVQFAHDKNTASVSNNTASASDSTVPETKTMYRILEFNGDTTVWDSTDCDIRDSSFSCRKEVVHDFSDIEKWLEGTIYGKKSPSISEIQKTNIKFQKEQKVIYKNLNFGKDAIVNYIPIADIPAFDRNNVAKLFSHLSGEPCTFLLTFRSNYKIEAIGLPDYFKWKTEDADKLYIRKNKAGQNTCISLNDIVSKLPTGRPLYYPTNKKFNQSRHDVDVRYLPEKKEIYKYQLLNYSLLYKDTTFSWKLVYKDQYGRGDTLDITTKFETSQNYTPIKCYDSARKKSSTKNIPFYRILDFSGDTIIWHPSDCKIFGNRFSCIRRVSAPKEEQCIYPYYNYANATFLDNLFSCVRKVSAPRETLCDYPYQKKYYAKATYKDLNFGKDAITNYIPVANIPEFNRDSVAKLFSILPSTSCSALLTFKSNYSIEPIGLPKDFEWRRDFPKAIVKEISKKKKMCTLEYRRASKRPDPYEEYHNVIFEELPEKARIYSYQLFNKSLRSYKDSTITWKLVYKDQYGRGNTLDITTKFE